MFSAIGVTDKDDVKELINASYNGSGKKFLNKWLTQTGAKEADLPAYYQHLLDEVQRMSADDSKDSELMECLRRAGVKEEKLASRVTFTKNECFEAGKRDAACKAHDAAGGSTLVSIEHDGTPRLPTEDVDLVKIAADAGVALVVKPYRTKEQIIEARKLYDPTIPSHFWDEPEVCWEEKATARALVLHYLLQKKKEDRQCPLVLATALRFLELPTKLGKKLISTLFVSVPQNKSSLYLWRWTWKWIQSPAAVHSGFLVNCCKDMVQDFMGPGIHQQTEMKSMFETAISHLIRTDLYDDEFINHLDANHDLILFECGRALHRDTKALFLFFFYIYICLSIYIYIYTIFKYL